MASKGLGRGLSALMSDSDDTEEQNEFLQAPKLADDAKNSQPTGVQVKAKLPAGITADENGTLWVNPDLLKPNPRQPRLYFNEDDLAELTESVRKEGVLSPVIIEDAGDGTFYIIAGERRTRASRAAGLSRIPVQLRKYSDERKLEVALIENIQRTDLNPVEEAQAYYKLMEIGNLTQDQVAERVGKNRSTVANCIRLLRLPDDIQKALVEGTITSGHARAILTLDTESDMRTAFGKIVGQGLSVRQTEALSKHMKEQGMHGHSSPSASPKEPVRDPNLVALEQSFIEKLGTKVQIKGDFERGAIVIDYFTRNDLDRLFSLIVPDADL